MTTEPSEYRRDVGGDEEFIIVLANGAILWVSECPLPLWQDKDGTTHFLRGVVVSDGTGKQHLAFFERPLTDHEGKTT